MRVGVYIDGYNLYYGARGVCGRSAPGWRWLDLRSLAQSFLDPNYWPGSSLARVVYCTARVDAVASPSAHIDQDVYLKALVKAGSVDHIEYGKFISKVRRAPLATADRKGRPILTRSTWPVMIQDADGRDVPEAVFMVSCAYREEKGSDVSVASHLLLDVLTDAVDAAIVISNDSDLRHPIDEARKRVPVGTVNPSKNHLAGDLGGEPDAGAGCHWWRQLTARDLTAHQLPETVGRYSRPDGW